MYEKYSHSYLAHIHPHPGIQIECVTHNRETGEGYPVLMIADATFFPTIAQLEKLHDVIGTYLGKHMPTPQTAPIDQETSDFLLGNHEPQEVASGG